MVFEVSSLIVITHSAPIDILIRRESLRLQYARAEDASGASIGDGYSCCNRIDCISLFPLFMPLFYGLMVCLA